MSFVLTVTVYNECFFVEDKFLSSTFLFNLNFIYICKIKMTFTLVIILVGT